MPKVKLGQTPSYKSAVRNIKMAMLSQGIENIKELANAVGWEYGYTYYRMATSPKSMRLEDLANLSNVLKVPIENLVSGVTER